MAMSSENVVDIARSSMNTLRVYLTLGTLAHIKFYSNRLYEHNHSTKQNDHSALNNLTSTTKMILNAKLF